jgi:uncharacterized protein YwqG
MLTPEAIDAFNTRLTVNLNNIKTMTASELDRVKSHGSTAEALLKNRDLALFIHQHKFDVVDQLTQISGHSVDDNSRRIAFSNQLAGIDSFVATLQRAVYLKNRVVTLQTEPTYNNQGI